MGASGHSRTVEVDGRDLNEIWKRLVDAEEAEYGYNSGFATKDEGFVLVAQTAAQVDRDLMRQAQLLIQWGPNIRLRQAAPNPSSYDGQKGRSVPFFPMEVEKTEFCYDCRGSGKRAVRQMVTLADGTKTEADVPTECDICSGSGRKPADAVTLAKRSAEVALRHAAVKTFGLTPAVLQRAYDLFSDKRGPAAALKADNLVLFTGMCSE